MSLTELYNKQSKYDIKDFIQEIPIDLDINTLRKDVFDLIIKNNYGTNVVSLRLPIDENDWTNDKEKLEDGSVFPFAINEDHTRPANDKHNAEYVKWHSDTSKYIKTLTADIEALTGQSIGRVRLAWLQPGKGYPIHADTDPMRIHIPLFTNDLAYIIHNGNMYNFKYGKVYHLITPSTHTAWNFGFMPRLHLIFSTHADKDITNKITEISSLSQAKENIKKHLSDSGIDSYSMAKLGQIKNLSVADNEFGFIKRINDILKGKD